MHVRDVRDGRRESDRRTERRTGRGTRTRLDAGPREDCVVNITRAGNVFLQVLGSWQYCTPYICLETMLLTTPRLQTLAVLLKSANLHWLRVTERITYYKLCVLVYTTVCMVQFNAT